MDFGTTRDMRSVFYPELINGPFGDPALYVRISHQKTALLFDCGSLHNYSGRALRKIDSVFVSHAHIDHLIGFDHLLRVFLPLDRHLTIYGPEGTIRQIQNRLGAYTWNLTSDYRFCLTACEWTAGHMIACTFCAETGFSPGPTRSEANDEGRLAETPDWTVKTAALEHGNIVSLAYALEETLHVAIHKDALLAHNYLPGPWLSSFKALLRRGVSDQRTISVPLVDGGHQDVALGTLKQSIAHCEPGMKVVYVADAAPSNENFEKIEALASEAHLLVIESAFAHDDFERARQRHHLTARLAGELGRRAGASKLMVFHHSPRYLDEPERLQAEAFAAFAAQ
jgi:ribonuclease Z